LPKICTMKTDVKQANAFPKHLVLFDGVCNLCDGVVQFILTKDSQQKFKFASLQSEIGRTLLEKFNLPTENFDSFVYITNNTVYQQSTAALLIAKELDSLLRFMYVLMIIPRPLRDFCYRLIAKNRYALFGKKDVCMMPTPELKSRFLG